MGVLVIDTETTGLAPKGYKNVNDSRLWSTCRMVQIAWTLFDTDGTELSSEVYIVKPDSFKIPERSTEKHGITDEIAKNNGIEILEIFEKLKLVLDKSDTIIAHNMAFDDSVIQSEMHRYKFVDVLKTWKTKEKKCTMMMESKNNVGAKWMKLSEIYEKYIGKVPDITLHRADNDVKLCADVYFAMIKSSSSA